MNARGRGQVPRQQLSWKEDPGCLLPVCRVQLSYSASSRETFLSVPFFVLVGSSSEMRGQGKEQSTYGVLCQLDSVLGLPCGGRASESSQSKPGGCGEAADGTDPTEDRSPWCRQGL